MGQLTSGEPTELGSIFYLRLLLQVFTGAILPTDWDRSYFYAP